MMLVTLGVIGHREPIHWPAVVNYAGVCDLLQGLRVDVEDPFWSDMVHDCIDIMLVGVERACPAVRL